MRIDPLWYKLVLPLLILLVFLYTVFPVGKYVDQQKLACENAGGIYLKLTSGGIFGSSVDVECVFPPKKL